jgi:hypothetical protein
MKAFDLRRWLAAAATFSCAGLVVAVPGTVATAGVTATTTAGVIAAATAAPSPSSSSSNIAPVPPRPAAAASFPGTAAPRHPAWPTLEQQLAADRVPPGSALERLIRDSQDFALLRAEEAGDGLGLPPWLRVAWRKAHPRGRYLPGDPSGGYPLVLQEVHEWMAGHPDLRAVAVAPRSPAAAPPAVAGGAAAAGALTESEEERASGAESGPRYESMIRIDGRHPDHIVGAANTGVGPEQMFYSQDGGATWGQSLLTLVENDSDDSDPGVDWTSDGTAWTTTIGIALPQFVLKLRSYRSSDGGATWSFDSTLSAGGTATDKDMLWADHSATSPFKDNLYVIWHDGQSVLLNRRTPAGGWMAAPLVLSAPGGAGEGIGADVRTNAGGDVFAFWPHTGKLQLFMVKSTDGGASFSQPQRIANTFGAFQVSLPAISTRKALIYASGGAWRTATRNEVYLAWMDLSGTAGCNAPGDEPGSDAASPCKARIWFARSTDGGATWSAAAKINDPPALDDQFAPWLAIDESDGELGIVYYDTIDDPSRLATNLYFQSSMDGGATWGPPRRVTAAASNETAAGAKLQTQYGDYNGMSGWNGRFSPSWTDRRNGGFEEIWSAVVADGGGGGCVASDTLLCLGANRFAVTALWTAADGQIGSGHAVPLSTDTGYLWFFSADNVEAVIKVLDGCALNGHYWVFAGGLTNVNVAITVTDLDNGLERTYTNPANTTFQPIQDTDAFATCP